MIYQPSGTDDPIDEYEDTLVRLPIIFSIAYILMPMFCGVLFWWSGVVTIDASVWMWLILYFLVVTAVSAFELATRASHLIIYPSELVIKYPLWKDKHIGWHQFYKITISNSRKYPPIRRYFEPNKILGLHYTNSRKHILFVQISIMPIEREQELFDFLLKIPEMAGLQLTRRTLWRGVFE